MAAVAERMDRQIQGKKQGDQLGGYGNNCRVENGGGGWGEGAALEVTTSGWILETYGRRANRSRWWVGCSCEICLGFGVGREIPLLVLVNFFFSKYFLSTCSLSAAGLSVFWEALGKSLEGKLTSFGLLGFSCEEL